ncbi:hypothetical protein N431DRAFT_478709 [Stipitochalara longipes BDJ]|nr:hypothetical protein N431DRAFT_478709 [Stipitochalara longipes BDJ]
MPYTYTECPFALEGGKYFLAEALHLQFKFRIRCPQCKAGDPQKQGFTLDQAGSGTQQARSRRYFSCQRSSSAKGKGGHPSCPRVTCSGYIALAIKQLPKQAFDDVVAAICAEYNPGNAKPNFAPLQAYMEPAYCQQIRSKNSDPGQGTVPPTSSLSRTTTAIKRKASQELPGHARNPWTPSLAFRKRPTSDTTQFTEGERNLLREMAAAWKQRQTQDMWPSLPYPAQAPYSPTPKTASKVPTGAWDEGDQFMSDGLLLSTSLNEVTSSVPFSDEPEISTSPSSISGSTTSAPCDVSSSIPEPQKKSSQEGGVASVCSLGTVAYRFKQDYVASAPRYPKQLPGIRTAANLLQAFQQAMEDPNPDTAKERKIEIRRQAKAAGIHSEFQALLTQSKTPPSSEENELKCSDRK